MAQQLTRWGAAAVCVVVAAYAAPAHAQPEFGALSEDEQSLVNAGLLGAKESFEAGDYERALDRLEEVYAIFPHPKILLRQGEAHQSLGNDAEALARYERFVEESPDDADAPEVQGKIVHLRNRLSEASSTLAVKTTPPGASVVVRKDGEEVARGTTPLELKVRAGSYSLEISRPGYIAQTERVAMKYKEKAALVYELAQPPAVQEPGALQWTLVGIGAASSIAAVGVGSWWISEELRWYELDDEIKGADDAEKQRLIAEQRAIVTPNNNRALVFWTTAGVGVATLVSAWLLWPDDEATVGVTPLPGGGAVHVHGRF